MIVVEKVSEIKKDKHRQIGRNAISVANVTYNDDEFVECSEEDVRKLITNSHSESCNL